MKLVSIILFLLLMVACEPPVPSQEEKDKRKVQQQQSQYAKGQPVPAFDWSLERSLVIKLYQLRNKKVTTHAVWRSNFGMIEGDCPSMGFGIPYDTSLTNPLQAEWQGYRDSRASAVTEQAEPNGIFASKNTSSTWVMCLNEAGMIEPVYIESKVTIYPYPVEVDYENDRVHRAGKSTVSFKVKKK